MIPHGTPANWFSARWQRRAFASSGKVRPQSVSTAVAVATDQLNAQQAFITGRIRLFGDQQKLQDSTPVFAALDTVFTTVRQRTDYR